jgi:hypothetical protein
MCRGRTHHSKPNFHHRTEIGPVMLERHRVDDVNGSIWKRVMSKEQTVDRLVGIFESMTDNFGVGEVVEAKVWA